MRDQPTPEVVEAVALRCALEDAVWPFLAHDPAKPDVFWGQMQGSILRVIRDAIHCDGADAEAIREILGLNRTPHTQWGVRDDQTGCVEWAGTTPSGTSGVFKEDEARYIARPPGKTLMRRQEATFRVVGEWQETQP